MSKNYLQTLNQNHICYPVKDFICVKYAIYSTHKNFSKSLMKNFAAK